MKKRYYELLPRKIPARSSCQHLNGNGSRCPNKAMWETTYHGDPELDLETGWVAIQLCKEHGSKLDREEFEAMEAKRK